MGKLLKLPVPEVPAALKGGYDNRKRKQSIRSSAWLIECAAQTLGGAIPLDPCAHRLKRHHFAQTNWTHGALERTWDQPNYANVPFKWLVLWLQYAQQQAAHTGLPTMVLGPWRSQRLGYCDAIRGATVVYFKAFPFEGYTNSPPFPVTLTIWNTDRWPRTPYEMARQRW